MFNLLKQKLHRSWPAMKRNAGFSLIELILAVVILAVIVTPIMHSFVTASNTSAKSQKIGEATDAATNIIEALNANSVTSFTEYCTKGSGTVDMPSILSMGGTPVTLSADDNNNDISTVNKLYYISGIKMGSSKFDARVTVTPGEASTPEYDSPTNGFYELNSNEIAKYIDPDEAFVQPYSDDANPDFIYYNASTKVRSGTYNQFYVKSGNSKFKNVQRTITIDISQSASKVYAYITYNYLFTYEKDAKNDSYVVVSRKYAIFPGGQAKYDGETPVTAYIMYYPFYAHEDTGNNDGRGQTDKFSNRSDIRNSDGISVIFEGNKDRIVVNNTSDVAIKLYLVKQRALAKDYDPATLKPKLDANSQFIYKRMALNASEKLDENGDGINEIITDEFGPYQYVEQYENMYRTTITEVRSTSYMAGYQNQIYANSAFNLATGKKIIGISPSYYQVVTNPLVAENCSDMISGSLVNTERSDRIYYVSVELFPEGTIKDNSVSTEDESKLIYKLSGSALK